MWRVHYLRLIHLQLAQNFFSELSEFDDSSIFFNSLFFFVSEPFFWGLLLHSNDSSLYFSECEFFGFCFFSVVSSTSNCSKYSIILMKFFFKAPKLMRTIFLHQTVGVMATRIDMISLSVKGSQTLHQVFYLVLGNSFLDRKVSEYFQDLLESFPSDSLVHLKPHLGDFDHNLFV